MIIKLPGIISCRAVAVYKKERRGCREQQKENHDHPDHNLAPADCRSIWIWCILFHRAFLTKAEPMVDGKSGFLYFDKNESICSSLHWEHYFQHIIQKYNNTYKVQMPVITPHVCRHTYCSNMAKSGMNPKALQYLMGHSDISVTLNVYTHVQFDDAQAELLRVAKA